jgi:beta-phosphoglucomutase-like phosphatase (HAD superfamily)
MAETSGVPPEAEDLTVPAAGKSVPGAPVADPVLAEPAAEGEPPGPEPPADEDPPADERPVRPPRRGWRIAVAALAGAACLAGAIVSGTVAHAELTRKPTSAELKAAEAIAVTQRWERWPAGRIFPAAIGYSTDLQTQETARRAGIAASADCASSVDSTLAALTRRFSCRAVLRASYVDELQGVVYTVGVLAFPGTRAAESFFAAMPAPDYPATGLRTLAVGGTATARFSDAARQAAAAREAGPYVVLVVAGYADGRPASIADERRDSVFAPAVQFARAIAAPLEQGAVVNCSVTAMWAC